MEKKNNFKKIETMRKRKKAYQATICSLKSFEEVMKTIIKLNIL